MLNARAPKRFKTPRKRGALYCFCVCGACGVLVDLPHLAGYADEPFVKSIAMGLFALGCVYGPLRPRCSV